MLLYDWKFELMNIINNDDSVNDVIKQNEINCVIAGDMNPSYFDGDSPLETWEAEKQEMIHNQ